MGFLHLIISAPQQFHRPDAARRNLYRDTANSAKATPFGDNLHRIFALLMIILLCPNLEYEEIVYALTIIIRANPRSVIRCQLFYPVAQPERIPKTCPYIIIWSLIRQITSRSMSSDDAASSPLHWRRRSALRRRLAAVEISRRIPSSPCKIIARSGVFEVRAVTGER